MVLFALLVTIIIQKNDYYKLYGEKKDYPFLVKFYYNVSNNILYAHITVIIFELEQPKNTDLGHKYL